MDVSESSSPIYSQPGSPSTASLSEPSSSKPSGLKLILPPLRAGKPLKGGKKSNRQPAAQLNLGGAQDEEKKIVRPAKLKPLKEVLTKLIAQIQKKDDYAFFLKPVDLSRVPGYKDIVQRPMDLGTMGSKVHRGKYRSLEDFASDLRLVASNAKLFNPPGTIYHTEADRIQAWGLDHIAKAAPTVIQYETDWNIEIEKDDDGTVNIDDDEFIVSTPTDIGEAGQTRRSLSVASQIPQSTGRRLTRGPYKKATSSNKVTESLDTEGRLPGSKDGFGSFPPGSDWAQTMLALKLKGKRYKSKKERLRVEKEGPPMHQDGSLDYTQMEDPFAVLSVFAQEPLSRPYVTPVLHPLSNPTHSAQLQFQYDPTTSRSQSLPVQLPTPLLTSINLPLDYSPPNIVVPVAGTADHSSRRHWVITRNLTRRGKEKDNDPELPEGLDLRPVREAHALDFGSFALLAGALEEEMRRRGVLAQEGDDEAKTLDSLRESMVCEATATADHLPSGSVESAGSGVAGYWTSQRAATAEEYIRDLVYGSVDGLAYTRSLAEFITDTQQSHVCTELGKPLSKWVEENIVDPLTDHRHALLREAALELATLSRSSLSRPHTDEYRSCVSTQVSNALHVYPAATIALAALLQIRTHKIDMASLIRTPEELFISEEEWAGKAFRKKWQSRRTVNKDDALHSPKTELEEPERTWMDVDAGTRGTAGGVTEGEYEQEGPGELTEVLDYVVGIINKLDRRIREGRYPSMETSGSSEVVVGLSSGSETKVKVEVNGGDMETVGDTGEDPILRNLRLNLLALAKRAPLDTIARLPKDLVPEHIRHFVPTLGVS